MPQDAFEPALARLLEATTPGSGDVQAALEANKALSTLAAQAGAEAVNAALDRLAAQLLVPEVEHSALIAMTCAALVDAGGTPAIAIDCVLTKLIDGVQQSRRFVDECRRLAREAERDWDDAKCIEQMAQVVADAQPDAGWAWRGLPFFCEAAASILGRCDDAPDIARGHTDLIAECRTLAEVQETTTLNSLRNLLNLLDVCSDFQLALRVITDPDAPGPLALSALAGIEFNADKLDADTRAEALREVAWAARCPGYHFPALLTRAGEVLIRHGGDATIPIHAFLDRFADAAAEALEFVRACRAARRGTAGDDGAVIAAAYDQVREQTPDTALAWSGIGSMASSLAAVLAYSTEARSAAAAHAELLPAIDQLAAVREDDKLRSVRRLGELLREN